MGQSLQNSKWTIGKYVSAINQTEKYALRQKWFVVFYLDCIICKVCTI